MDLSALRSNFKIVKPNDEAKSVLGFVGTITKCEMRSEPARGYHYGREVNDVKAMIALRDENGNEVWFFSPAARHCITQGGPYYCSTVEPNDFIDKKGWSTKGAMGSAGFGEVPELKLRVGQSNPTECEQRREEERSQKDEHQAPRPSTARSPSSAQRLLERDVRHEPRPAKSV
jgi:hypothetical protein